MGLILGEPVFLSLWTFLTFLFRLIFVVFALTVKGLRNLELSLFSAHQKFFLTNFVFSLYQFLATYIFLTKGRAENRFELKL